MEGASPKFVWGDSGYQETLSWQRIHTFFCCRYTILPYNVKAFQVILSVICRPTWVEFSTRPNPVILMSNHDLEKIGPLKTMIYRREKTFCKYLNYLSSLFLKKNW
jgi:hypothetical protein